ncbi:MAG: 50S ribosomal protein L18 [Promethearchaeota archaeon]
MRSHGPRYRVNFRRRREGKTNYHLRRKLLLSNRFRFVIRKSNRYITVQILKTHPEGDQTIISAHSKELRDKFNWKGNCGSIPAAYLTGLLAGYRAQEAELTEVVVDIGLVSPIKGAKVYAVLKGALDAGLSIPHSEDVLPEESRIRGEDIANYAKQLSETAADEEPISRHVFSLVVKRGLQPQDLPRHFDETKNKIASSFD